MSRLSEEQINDIRSRADIAEIIGHYIPLTKKGKGLGAVCPFHDDHDPSLSISLDKQIYKCFVCGAGGNVFTFVQQIENISFIEAVAKVAELVGIQLDIKIEKEYDHYDDQTKRYFKALEEANLFLSYQLQSVDGKEVKAYLVKRGMTDAIIQTFQIGYNPTNNVLYTFLSKKGIADQDMVAVNVARIANDGIKDVFSNRITFPIHDTFGNPIGYTARSLSSDSSIPKYINTNETSIYTKGNIVYNYHRAKSFIKKQQFVYLVEGVIDVIAYYKADMQNCVATLGTAATTYQLKELKKLTSLIVFSYDGDKAGQNATYKAGVLANQLGFQVKVVQNLTGLDPDEIIEKQGIDALKQISSQHITWMEFLFQYFKDKYDLQNYSQRKEYATVLCKEIQILPDRFDRQNFLFQLSQITQFDVKQLEDLVQNKPVEKKNVRVPRQNRLEIPISGKTKAEQEILRQMLLNKEASILFKDQLGFLPTKEYNTLAMFILDYYRKNDIVLVADFMNVLEDDGQKKFIMDITQSEVAQNDYEKLIMEDAILKIKVALIDEKINQLKQLQSQQAHEPLDIAKWTDQLIQLKKEKDKLMKNSITKY